ncbi:MAG: class I tRNA ligase family protein, partial [Gammaproteobacteria bacterium]|nr:class I tRNA ligase family protein [Gammaproteobacteria bacterium]
WGRGRPGWHIECSAMIAAHLGKTIDIHGGGNDLVFPHHENEIAQSRCAHGGKPLSRFWLHNGFVNVSAEKMSKSLGNVLLVRDLLAMAPAEAIRYTLLSAHYRAPLDWTDAAVQQSKAALDTLYQSLRELAEVSAANEPQPPAAFVRHLEDDLNTPRALAELFALAHAANKSTDDQERAGLKGALLASGRLLGLLQQDPEAWFGAGKEKLDVEYVERLVAERDAARAAKDFALADRLRDELAGLGVVLEDRAGGTRWRIQN